MTSLDELLRLHGRLTTMHVERWVARGLLRPLEQGDAWSFEQVDVARARLLAELEADIGLDDDTVEAVVALVDQVHTLRNQLGLLAQAIAEQPPETREAIAAALRRHRWALSLAPTLPCWEFALAVDRLPHLVRGDRHVDMVHAIRLQSVDHGVAQGCRRALVGISPTP
jgi:chaperone modulatory protein CbpM